MKETPDRDGQIRAAIHGNDSRALEMIWEDYADDLLTFLTARLGSRHDGEDVLQNLFLKTARNRRLLARARSVRAYLFTCARNAAIDYRRKAKPTIPLEAIDFGLVAEPTPKGPSDDSTVAIGRALAALPTDQREVVMLKTYRNMTFRDIATSVGASPNTVASRYRYGLEKLEAMLEELR